MRICRWGNKEQAVFNAKVDEALAQAESDLSTLTAGTAATSGIKKVKESTQKGRLFQCGWWIHCGQFGRGIQQWEKDWASGEGSWKKATKQHKKHSQGPVKFRMGRAIYQLLLNPKWWGGLLQQCHSSQPRRQAALVAARPVEPCHFCGKMGHLCLYCPARKGAANWKWYPFHVECVAVVNVKCRVYRV